MASCLLYILPSSFIDRFYGAYRPSSLLPSKLKSYSSVTFVCQDITPISSLIVLSLPVISISAVFSPSWFWLSSSKYILIRYKFLYDLNVNKCEKISFIYASKSYTFPTTDNRRRATECIMLSLRITCTSMKK